MKNGWFYNKNKEIPSEAAANNKINFLLKKVDPGSEPWGLWAMDSTSGKSQPAY